MHMPTVCARFADLGTGSPNQSLALVLFTLMMMGGASARTYCVNSTANTVIALCNGVPGDCSLRGAMLLANEGDEGTVQDIRVPVGTYALPAGLNFDPVGDRDNKDFSISGGWNAACVAHTLNPANTVLNGENGANDGLFEFSGDQQRIVIEGLTWQNFSQVVVFDPVCAPFNLCPDTDLIRVRYNAFRNGQGVLVSANDANQYSVSNNLFVNLSASSIPPVDLSDDSDGSAPVFAFNTLANLQCGGSGLPGVRFSSRPSGSTLHHNVIQSLDCGSDLFLEDFSGFPPVALRNNLYNTRSGQSPSVQSGNLISSNPGFVNAAGGDFHLRESAPVSAAINAGLTPAQGVQFGLSFPSQDLDGPVNLRVVGLRADIGAYESSINDASVLNVSNGNDSGTGSLRQALISANANIGKQNIEFNVPGTCPQLILLQTPLPDINDDVEIDGYTQPGASANTQTVGSDANICLVLTAVTGTLGAFIQVSQAAPSNTSLTLKGLAFAGANGFNGNATVALGLRGGSDHIIQGNAFGGVGPGGVGPLGAPIIAIQITGTAQNALIGGPEPEHRNSFGETQVAAIYVNGATSGNVSGHTVQNNYIGLAADGTTAATIQGNAILADSAPNLSILDNVIAAVPNNAAIRIQGASATGFKIRGNRIGMSAINIPTATFRVDVGISVGGGSGDHEIGSALATTPSNTIANSKRAGVWINSDAGNGILMRPNKIFGNGVSGIGLGIDLGALGPLPNDSGDGDGGANRSQNWPEMTASVANVDTTRQVNVVLNSTASTSYRLDLYRSPDCAGGNRGANMSTRVSTNVVTTSSLGLAVLNTAISDNGAPGFLAATATNTVTGDTSEVGPCFQEPPNPALFKSGFE